MRLLRKAFAFSILSLFFWTASPQDAQALEWVGCHHAVQISAEAENNCDGSITTHYYYYNPNQCAVRFFNICLLECGTKHLPAGIQLLGDGGLLSVNMMLSGPIDQGQETHFQVGGPHYSHSIATPANEAAPTWKLYHNPLFNAPQYASADLESVPLSCPIVPEAECMEALPDHQYKANFRVKNYNTQEVCIPAGSSAAGINRFTNGIGNDQGQPVCFPAWPNEETFTLDWDGTDTRWRIDPADCDSTLHNCNSFAPATGEVGVGYYHEVIQVEVCLESPAIPASECPGATEVISTYVNRCESFPVNPHLTCTFDNSDGTVTAYFGYHSYQSDPQSISAGTWIPGITPQWFPGGGNMVVPFNPMQSVPSLQIEGQPTLFAPGRHPAVMNVTWDTAESQAMFWVLYMSQWNHLSSAEAYASSSSISKQCKSIRPLACIKQTTDGNENGYLTARFGYTNANQFAITLDNPELNYVTGGFDLTPEVPNTFVPGGKAPGQAFSVKFADEESVSWTIAGQERVVSMHSARLCVPNELPTCSILGQTGLNCGGVTTSTSFEAQGIDPEGRDVVYTWKVNCGEDGVSSSYVVSGDNGQYLDLDLFGPGAGTGLEAGDCVVTLGVHDGFGSSSCSVEVLSDACDLDCAGEPVVGSPLNQVDECGICLPAGSAEFNTACADCAGVPNGASEEDGFGTCCLASEIDDCGLCGGNNDSCLECVAVSNVSSVVTLESGSDAQRANVRRASRVLRKAARQLGNGSISRRERRVVRRLNRDANNIAAYNLSVALSMPLEVQNCANEQLCSSVSHVDNINLFAENSDRLRKLARRGARRARILTGQRNLGRKVLNVANQLHEANLLALSSIPQESSECN